MKLNVGDYVRTNKGEFGKVTSVAKENLGFGDMEFCNTEPYVYGDIIKSSPNIIDLIRKNEDYVNGKLLDEGEYEFYKTYPVYIKSVVTKEQFEQMEYKVED